MRPELRDIIKKLPKLRGHGKNRAQTVNAERVRPAVVNIAALENGFKAGDDITPKSLVASGVVATRRRRIPSVKILGQGELSKKLTVSGCEVSASAKEKIEKAGGSVA
jgi:large subunit ribosomal protein L15